MWKLTTNDAVPTRGFKMQVKELRDSLLAFAPTAPISVVIPSLTQAPALRAIHSVGHLAHPNEVKTDHTIHGVDVVCDHWDNPVGPGVVATVGDLLESLEPFPEPMPIRIAVPLSHDSVSHRMLDIAMFGHAAGAGAGGIHIICENWDNPYQVIRSKKEG